MRKFSFAAGVLAAGCSTFASAQNQVMMVPVAGSNPAPVSQTITDPKDSPEEIAKDAQRDLKDSRFYNRPGATRAQYDADWQTCRLIARGSRTPGTNVPYVYNPAVVSPLAAGVGGAVGGMIGAAIAEGIQRRANRRNCLLIKGWRLVELPSADAARVSAMSDADKNAYFNSIIGAKTVPGKITERTSFLPKADAALAVDAPLTSGSTVFLGKKALPGPVALAANEGAVVFAFRRTHAATTGRSASLQFARYDLEKRDLMYQPRNWKKVGDKTTYFTTAYSGDKKSGHEVQVVRLTPGDYVITGASIGPAQVMATNCFGAPTFHVGAGEVVYLGDFLPYMGAPLSDGEKYYGLGYTSKLEETRRGLATTQPALAAALKPATIRNQATYACAAITMDRFDLPGASPLPDLVPVAASGIAAATAGR